MSALEIPQWPAVRRFGGWVLVVALALILAFFLAQRLLEIPKIGLLEIEGSITSSDLDEVIPWLKFARDQGDIHAVVLVIDSPGGGAASSQEIYYQMLALRERKPVVASINGLGASGAYHIAIASNFIYAKPASLVGSVGTRSRVPRAERPDEESLTTGPFKDPGLSRDGLVRSLQLLQQNFVAEVMAQRGAKLQLSREELSQGGIYVGLEALRFGLVDGLGSRAEAIEKAAELAGLTRYDVVSIQEAWEETQPSAQSAVSRFRQQSDPLPTPVEPMFFHLYSEP